MKLKLFAAAALIICCIAPHSAQAQGSLPITFQFTPAVQSGHAGDTVYFTGTLTNTSDAEVFLNGDSYSGLPSSWTFDDNPFFNNAPLSLAAAGDTGDSYTGSLFDIVIASDASPGTSTGTFAITGGADENGSDTVASADFSVDVLPDAAPEPSQLTLFGLSVFALAGLTWRAHRRAAQTL